MAEPHLKAARAASEAFQRFAIATRGKLIIPADCVTQAQELNDRMAELREALDPPAPHEFEGGPWDG